MQPEVRDSVLDAFMALLAERPWSEVTLEAVAERSGRGLSELRAGFDGRIDILREFTRRTDETVLAGIDPQMAGEGARERLFDILFSRIEALGPHKRALGRLFDAAWRDPVLALELNRIATISMSWMLTAAGVRTTGRMGALRSQGLALVWSRVLRVWLNDDDPTLPRTMAELDVQLRRSERAVIRIERFCRTLRPRRDESRPDPTPPPAAAGDVAEAHPS